MGKIVLDFNIPIYLQKSIDSYNDAVNRKDKISWDLYYSDLRASINMTEADRDISTEEANVLRKYYL